MDLNRLTGLVSAIADVGAEAKIRPPLPDFAPFRHYFADGVLDASLLDESDGGGTRRELLARALLLNAVLDQGPDIEGVRDLLVRSVNRFYEQEVRIFHRPLDFFQEIQLAVEEIWDAHRRVKAERAEQWARENRSTSTKYNLYMDNTKQTLNYAVFRWGVPLALPHLLAQSTDDAGGTTALVDYLEQYDSAENMSIGLKTHDKFGLGKAIGNKACHLFAKWMVSTFRLSKRTDLSWGEYSYEVPFDSNAGRVLWRTGYLLALSDIDAYRRARVVQPEAGKGGADYLRVTKLRGLRVTEHIDDSGIVDTYRTLCLKHWRSHKRAPRKLEIQRFQHPLLYRENRRVADFDDGLIEIGRHYCYNHEAPNCADCPIRQHCRGNRSDRALIEDYRT